MGDPRGRLHRNGVRYCSRGGGLLRYRGLAVLLIQRGACFDGCFVIRGLVNSSVGATLVVARRVSVSEIVSLTAGAPFPVLDVP